MSRNTGPVAIVAGAVFGLVALALDAATGHQGQTVIDDAHWHGLSAALKIHQWHAVALIATGALLLQRDSAWWRAAVCAHAAGIILFSGGLYLVAAGVPVGFVTPIGGLVLMLGWLLLAIGGWFVGRE